MMTSINCFHESGIINNTLLDNINVRRVLLGLKYIFIKVICLNFEIHVEIYIYLNTYKYNLIVYGLLLLLLFIA